VSTPSAIRERITASEPVILTGNLFIIISDFGFEISDLIVFKILIF
jgi:hypothetical protein